MIYKKKGNIKIQDVHVHDKNILGDFINDIICFMGDLKDPVEETKEAVHKTIKEGFCIEAVQQDHKRVGVLVLTRAPFDKFQPKYHLAYIAVSPSERGKGIGRLLLETAREVTNDSIALHVGFSNQKAISFYEKVGWKKVYCRMMPDK